jgi:hypothetical protein
MALPNHSLLSYLLDCSADSHNNDSKQDGENDNDGSIER